MENAGRTVLSRQSHEETRTSCPLGTPTQPACRRHSTSEFNEEIHPNSHRRDGDSIVVETTALKAHGPPDYPRQPLFRIGSMATESGTNTLGSRRNPFGHICAS